MLVTLSEWPEAIDTEQHERPSPQLLALAHLLEPFIYSRKRSGWFFFLDNDGMEDMRRWIRRFCP